MSLANKIIDFNQFFLPKITLPSGVEMMYPFQNEETFALSSAFYQKFYADNSSRNLILGINPGRFGAGLTGVPFTDPIKLEQYCGIKNNLPKKVELSADFIYAVIKAYGGLDNFYNTFYISSVFPLGFVKDGKNLNYYDLPELKKALVPIVIDHLETQIQFGLNTDRVWCLGEGENFKYLKRLNDKHRFFKAITPLPHPRYVMQYKRKFLTDYIDLYLKALRG